jgi:hypothetical protein
MSIANGRNGCNIRSLHRSGDEMNPDSEAGTRLQIGYSQRHERIMRGLD